MKCHTIRLNKGCVSQYLILSLLLFPLATSAQVVQWLIPPHYDEIEFPADANIAITDSANVSTIWSLKGRRLLTTTEMVHPFSNGHVVTTGYDDAYITGIYDANGTPVPFEKVQLGWGYPCFHDGHLLVHDGHYFHYMDVNGNVDNTLFWRAYPFSQGYASCFTFEDMRKQKNPYYLLIDRDLKPITLTLEGKRLGNDDPEFISSFNDEGLAVISVKRRLYYIDAANLELRPIFADAEGKSQARVDGDIGQWLTNREDSTLIKAKSGKTTVQITLDDMLRPVAITTDGQRHEYQRKSGIRFDDNSPFTTREAANGKTGFMLGERELLPPQFDRVLYIFGQRALVVFNGKYGVIEIHPDDNLRISLNKGNPVAFRHRHFDSTIRIDMPTYINPDDTSIELDGQADCVIDKISKETRATEFGNSVEYKCVLNMPLTIPDDETIELTYPLHIVHEGLRTPLTSAKVDAWRYKYHNVDVSNKESSIENGSLTFCTDISAERLPGEDLYPYTCKLVTESLRWEFVEKVSETRYKWKVYNLKEGTNNIVVQILEDGCPPADYTFEVDYQRPTVPNATNTPVVLKEKKKKATTPPVKRHLDI